MKTVFADTFFFLAILNRADPPHDFEQAGFKVLLG